MPGRLSHHSCKTNNMNHFILDQFCEQSNTRLSAYLPINQFFLHFCGFVSSYQWAFISGDLFHCERGSATSNIYMLRGCTAHKGGHNINVKFCITLRFFLPMCFGFSEKIRLFKLEAWNNLLHTHSMYSCIHVQCTCTMHTHTHTHTHASKHTDMYMEAHV